MPRGGLPEATLAKVAYHDYWEHAVHKWGHTDNWDTYYLQQHENATIEISEFKAISMPSRAAVLMRDALKLQKNQSSAEEPSTFSSNSPQIPSNDPPHEILLFVSPVAATLLSYRRILEEMRNHHNEEQPQRGRHLSIMLTWSVVGWSLFTDLQSTSTSLPAPSINVSLLELVLKDSSNKQIQHGAAIIGDLIAKGIVKNTKLYI
ncbi:hypothetical protein G9A89_003677 [Geosiphon pyriformis]|nr:hypothetical protein G9A89_003677 [Geosiphon pyriformis]